MNNSSDQFNNIFIGTLGHQLTGKLEFWDEQNELYGFFEMGIVKKKTQDYFTGEIQHKKKKIADIYGNYMGYMDIGGVRFVDTREVSQYYFPI